MSDLLERLRGGLLPALLTAVGVALLAAGVLTMTTPVAADPGVAPGTSPGPVDILPSPPAPTLPSPTPPARTPSASVSGSPVASPGPASSPSPAVSQDPSASPVSSPGPASSPSPAVSQDPSASPVPSATAPAATRAPNRDHLATRVRIAALQIDLPVVRGTSDYPLCDVAMYLKELGQPGQGRAIYLYAHARTGMFLPLLRTPGGEQRGLVVEVWTNDDQRYRYEIVQVRRDQRDLDDALNATTEQLWLQTSEGPKGTPGKTQVIARPVSVEAADPADAHPAPRPVVCG